jgi:hypothetical protein
MNSTRIAFRVGLLLESGQSSAVECAKDAIECSHNAQFGRPFPNAASTQCGIPAVINDSANKWTEAAERWTERGASHAWGFERPLGW